ncbi:MAG TPA: ATP-binding protein [Candidatus Eremiobacteraceae bacterium]|nr:ATP-binding protein [Candidatus Eremiobacteraceae bacterium]
MAPLLALSAARRSAPLLYLELTGIERVPRSRRRRVLATYKRAVAAALRAAVGTALRRSDAIAAGPGAHCFVALLVGRAVAAPARDGVADAQLGLIAGRLRAAVRAQLLELAGAELGQSAGEIGVIAGWTVLDPVAVAQPLEDVRQAIRGAAVVARVEAQRALVLAAVTHELRTPLMSILGYAERLRDEADLTPHARAHYGGIVAREARRLHRLVESLIDTGAWTAGKLVLRRRQLDLQALVRTAWAASAAGARGSRPRLEIRGDARAAVDRERLMQVFINLLDNAARHSPKGARVSVRIARRGDTAVVAVADEGPGFSRRAAGAVGTPFAPGADGRAGLGLSIARLLVEAHGGAVTFGRGRRRGARVCVSLPCRGTRAT